MSRLWSVSCNCHFQLLAYLRLISRAGRHQWGRAGPLERRTGPLSAGVHRLSRRNHTLIRVVLKMPLSIGPVNGVWRRCSSGDLEFDGRRVWVTLGELVDFEASAFELRPDNGRLVKAEVEADRLAEPFVAMDDVRADVKGQGQRPAGTEHTLHLAQRLLRLSIVEMNDRVEGDDASKRLILERQLEHVTDLEGQPGKQAARLFDHRRRQVEAGHVGATAGQVARDVPGPQPSSATGPSPTRSPKRSRNPRSNGLDASSPAIASA